MKITISLFAIFLLLVSCGQRGRGRRAVAPTEDVVSGVTGITADEEASFRRLISSYSLENVIFRPGGATARGLKNEFSIKYASEQSLNIVLTDQEDPTNNGRACKYSYSHSIVREDIDNEAEEGSLFILPVKPKFEGIPGSGFHDLCEDYRVKKINNIISDNESHYTSLQGRFERYKNYLNTHIIGLMDICENGEELSNGSRCKELQIVNLIRNQRPDFFEGNQQIFEAIIRTDKDEEFPLKIVFTLDFTHFLFGGLLQQVGSSLVPTQSDQELTSFSYTVEESF